MATVSLILYLYNEQENLAACLHSIQQQSLTDWQVLLVDDGSTDQTGAICEAFAKEDARFLVLHQKHQGQVFCLQKALQQATGDYLMFVEADGLLKANALERSVKLAKETSSDIILFEWLDRNGENNGTAKVSTKIRNEHHLLVNQIIRGELPAYLWGKLYDRKLWQKVGLLSDKQAVKEVFLKANNVFYLPAVLYIHNHLRLQFVNKKNSFSFKHLLASCFCW